jgi:hypothetical protein
MNDEQQQRTLKILVPGQETSQVAIEERPLQPGEAREHAGFSFIRRWLAKDENIDLFKAKGELQRVEGEIDELLGTLEAERKSGYHLAEVQVSVGISAQGSIGVVTAGLQASLTLVYSRTPGS